MNLKIFTYVIAGMVQCLAVAPALHVSAQAVLFDFDNIPAHSGLPVSQTVNGITAHLSATGQGFSIQQANVLGFTPVGFSGNVIYPNSIYQADLLIGFDSAIIDFSIMYSCQELGCDDAATMRVTAYMNGSLVGFNTKTASNPGTWPVDVLRCSFPQGFNSVVVHYDKRPPTCQDYGVIFMADNMRVTTYNPVTMQLCPAQAATALSFDISGTNYQWQTGTSSGFSNISDNANYTGTNSATLQIKNITSAWTGTTYRCLVDGGYSNVFTLQFYDAWTGIFNTAWENPANWSCNKIPDANTDVLVEATAAYFPVISSNTSCRSLRLPPGVVVTVNPGFVLQVTGKK